MNYRNVLCGSACIVALASSASNAAAQQAAANPPAQAAPTLVVAQNGPSGPNAPNSTGAPPPEVATVFITGSRIVRNGYNAPTPVTVAPIAELQMTTPSNIADALNKLPEFNDSYTQATLTNTTALPQGNYVNLRDLSTNQANRTLVLLDGERVPPTTAYGQVDVNMLPELLVQRVDIVTGGASAVYGSDAVAGVVNYILDTRFNGFKAVAQTGISTYGDAPSQRFGLAWGGDVSDRGHFEFSIEHYSEAGLDQNDRSFSADAPAVTGLGTAASPYQMTYNNRLGGITSASPLYPAGVITGETYGGLILPTNLVAGQTRAPPAGYGGYMFGPNGSTLTKFVPGTPTGSVTVATAEDVGGDGAYFADEGLLKPLETNQVFGRFDYDLGHEIMAYAQVSGGESDTQFRGGNALLTYDIYNGNPYLPAGLSSTSGSFAVGQLPNALESLSETYQDNSAISATIGLNGKVFNDNFNWNVHYIYGQSSLNSVTTNNVNTVALDAALDAVTPAGGGAPVCHVSTTAYANLPQYAKCAPIDLFGVGNYSAASLAYILQNTSFNTVNKTNDVEANISGSAFNDWAGPVSLAANAEFRTQSLDQTGVNPGSLATTVPTGLRQSLPTAGSSSTELPYLYGTESPEAGSNSVWEVSGETVVPLLKDLPLIQNLDANAAVRFTDYSTSGDATTWKIGFNYQPINDLRFRATESRDIRAPDLYDLFAAPNYNIAVTTDAMSGKVGPVITETKGNPNLLPEVAFTMTAGVVYSPSWFKPFKISVDYFDIKIDNAIGQLSGNLLTAYCHASATSPFCADIQHASGATSLATQIYTPTLNLASIHTSGFDAEASYALKLSTIQPSLPGLLTVRALFTYQPELIEVSAAGQPGYNYAGTVGSATPGDNSIDRGTLMVNYGVGPLALSWETRYSSGLKWGNGIYGSVYDIKNLPDAIYNDLGASYRFRVGGRDLQAFVAVDNLFNQQPRISGDIAATSGYGAPAVTGDDVIGRYYTAGLRVGF
jgi:outer membrane receptor protein involved in Fe transport